MTNLTGKTTIRLPGGTVMTVRDAVAQGLCRVQVVWLLMHNDNYGSCHPQPPKWRRDGVVQYASEYNACLARNFAGCKPSTKVVREYQLLHVGTGGLYGRISRRTAQILEKLQNKVNT